MIRKPGFWIALFVIALFVAPKMTMEFGHNLASILQGLASALHLH